MTGFEGSFLGKADRIADSTRMECGVCWWVYDPACGDEVWHIPPHTPFSQLPDHWRCPNCDATSEQFMALNARSEPGAKPRRRPGRNARAESLAARARQLADGYRKASAAMESLPVYNHQLEIEIVGMRRCKIGDVAVAATPWCMNIVLLASDDGRRREGNSRELEFPSGIYSFVTGHLPHFGAIETCSLFSPMQQFQDPAAVKAVAQEAMTSLFKADNEPSAARISRRQFLRPGASG